MRNHPNSLSFYFLRLFDIHLLCPLQSGFSSLGTMYNRHRQLYFASTACFSRSVKLWDRRNSQTVTPPQGLNDTTICVVDENAPRQCVDRRCNRRLRHHHPDIRLLNVMDSLKAYDFVHLPCHIAKWLFEPTKFQCRTLLIHLDSLVCLNNAIMNVI